MLTRDEDGQAENIAINWGAQLDQEILKLVVFHEIESILLTHLTQL